MLDMFKKQYEIIARYNFVATSSLSKKDVFKFLLLIIQYPF